MDSADSTTPVDSWYSVDFPFDLVLRHVFGKAEKVTCVNSSGVNATFDISYNLWLSAAFLLQFDSCTSIFAHQCKFRFHSFRHKMINLVLVVKYRFDFRLKFDINKKNISKVFSYLIIVMVHAIISAANLGGGAWVVRLAEVTPAPPPPLTPSLFFDLLESRRRQY